MSMFDLDLRLIRVMQIVMECIYDCVRFEKHAETKSFRFSSVKITIPAGPINDVVKPLSQVLQTCSLR